MKRVWENLSGGIRSIMDISDIVEVRTGETVLTVFFERSEIY